MANKDLYILIAFDFAFVSAFCRCVLVALLAWSDM